jgi:ABC-2 type transport system permease protein
MKIILKLMYVYLLLIIRIPISLFFNILLPLLFFIFYAGVVTHTRGAALGSLIVRLVTLGALSNGLFGLSIILVVMRERDILRRYHLTPISAFHVVASRLLANYLMFLIGTVLELLIAKFAFQFDLWPVLPQLLVIFSLGYLAVAGIGFLIASIVNTVNDAQVFNQLTFLLLLFLSGVAVPLSIMPVILQRLSAFMPPALTILGANEILTRGGTAHFPWQEMVCLAMIAVVTLGVSTVMFRWEKEAKVSSRDRLKAAVILVPLIIAGIWLNTSSSFIERVGRTTEKISTRGPATTSDSGEPVKPAP